MASPRLQDIRGLGWGSTAQGRWLRSQLSLGNHRVHHTAVGTEQSDVGSMLSHLTRNILVDKLLGTGGYLRRSLDPGQ